jgi:hypothetical protein
MKDDDDDDTDDNKSSETECRPFETCSFHLDFITVALVNICFVV